MSLLATLTAPHLDLWGTEASRNSIREPAETIGRYVHPGQWQHFDKPMIDGILGGRPCWIM
jgi:hypothetical protein